MFVPPRQDKLANERGVGAIDSIARNANPDRFGEPPLPQPQSQAFEK